MAIGRQQKQSKKDIIGHALHCTILVYSSDWKALCLKLKKGERQSYQKKRFDKKQTFNDYH